MHAVGAPEPGSRSDSDDTPAEASASSPTDPDTNFRDEERGLSAPVPLSVRTSSIGQSSSTAVGEDTELRPTSLITAGGFIKKKASQLMDAVSLSSRKGSDSSVAPRLASLVDAFANSEIAAAVKAEIEHVKAITVENGNTGDMRDVAVETSLVRGRKRASWGMQFRILSGRAFKNLYRDPALLAAHYVASIVLACEYILFCGPSFMLTWVFSVVRVVLSRRDVS